MRSFFVFLSKNKLYTAINLFGLAVSLMFVILIANYSSGMLGVDRFHEHSDRIYLMGTGGEYYSNYAVMTQLQEQFPEIEKICSIAGGNKIAFTNDDNKISTSILFADSTFFEFFSFPFIYGERDNALNSRDKAVITETFALKMFGSTNVVGETIYISYEEKEEPFVVSAVIKDLVHTVIPNNKEIIIQHQNTKRLAVNDYYSPNVIMKGGDASNKTFIMVKEGADLMAKKEMICDYLKENDMDFKLSKKTEVLLTPLPKVMLDPRNSGNGGLENGSGEMLFILLSAGIAILVFAVTNYISLTVAQTGFRAREMACRRLLGDSGNGITTRLIMESSLMTALAFVLGFILAVMVQDYASNLSGERIDIMAGLTPSVIALYLLFVIIIGTIAGSIPAYTMSRYKPIDIVRGSLRYRSKMVFSKIFIVFQNVITIVMLVSSMTIYLQIRHLINAPLGHNTKNIIEAVDWKMTSSEFLAFESELRQLPCVERIGLGKNTALFVGMNNMQSFTDKDGNDQWMTMMKLDSNAVDILGLELISNHITASDAVYLNEEAANALGVGMDDSDFSIDYGGGANKNILGGIYKNFRLGDVLNEYQPIIIYPISGETSSDSYTTGTIIYIKVTGDCKEALAAITKAYTAVTSREDVSIFRIGEDYLALKFRKERNVATIMLIFTIIALIISALGLFAMSTFFTRQRIKEIGIRKIFGGSKDVILRKQLWSFIVPIIISLVIATPTAYFIMERWLQNYSYRITISPLLFIAAGLFIIAIGILTVLGQSLKAVNSNPIKAIRTE